ncbi:MAG: hypothetical protein H6633_20305 [Anaerolineales bacterium]|nr:hypothetical protein [Anaerolineales bacterium]
MTVYKLDKKVKRELKDSHKAILPIQYLSVEILDILWSYYLLQTLPYELDSDDRLENLRTLKFIELLIGDIILRLCKFRDNDSRSLSFEQAIKDLRKRSATKGRVEGLEPVIKKYKVTTQNIENHRNSYIAHLSKRDRTHLKPTSEIYEAIQLAVQIVDTLSGEQNSYSIEGIDLRKTVLQDRP